MKKVLLAVIVLSVLGITSCKKEEGAQPDSKNNAVKVLNKKDTTQWD
ncbi:hypothetical protein GZH53_08505 [Flavihumibacter sp. R14]|nr:hypothetical protein [Flavihumibacter soli]